MTKTSTFELKFKRRREGRTDYKKRLALIKSGKPKLAVRKSNRYIVAEIMKYEKEGDATLAYVFSKELEKFGWKGSRKNTPAGYLTGLLLGIRAKKSGVKEVVADIGLHTPTHGSVVFAVVKGVSDAGISVPYDASALPKDERISGKHISAYGKAKDSKGIEAVFESAKAEIMKGDGGAGKPAASAGERKVKG